MFVANAVFPIAGRPANIIKSESLSPPVFASRASSPVGTPDILPSFWYADSIRFTESVKAVAKSIKPVWVSPWLARSKRRFSAFSICSEASLSISSFVALFTISNPVAINSRRKYLSYINCA